MNVNIKELIGNVKSSKEYIDYVKYHENNIFSITKVSRWELMHSNFIAWLLDPSESHALAFYPIVHFMQMLCNINLSRYPITHSTDVFCDNNNIQKVDIIREQPVPVTDKNGKTKTKKIDLLIKVKYDDGVLPIVVENKVGSHENGEDKDQTKVYYNWGEANLKCEFKPIYLCLVPLFNKIDPKCKEFTVIDYQQLVYNVIEPCLWRTNNNWTHDTINTYLQCLSYQTDNEKGHNTMAISTEERKILTDFLENNDTFINSLLDIFSEDATEDEKAAIAKVRTTAKDFSKFEFDGETYNKRRLVLAVVKKYVDSENPADFKALLKVFPNNLQGSHGVVKIKSSLSSNQHRNYFMDNEIQLADGSIIVVCNQWGDNLKTFVDYVTGAPLGYSIIRK